MPKDELIVQLIKIALGIAMGLNHDVEYALDPFVWFLYSTPMISIVGPGSFVLNCRSMPSVGSTPITK